MANLVGLGSTFSASAKVRGGRASGEVSGEHGSHEGTEDELGTTEGGEREPEEEDKLESEVEGEPVDNANKALDNGEEREDNPVGEPLSVIGGVRGEESVEGVVARDDEPGNVGQQLTAQVEDDQEEIQGAQADGSVSLGETGGLLEVGDGRVLGELSVKSANILLHTILRGRHDDSCKKITSQMGNCEDTVVGFEKKICGC